MRDYAHKEWNGLLSSLYLDRWKEFFNIELAKMDGKQIVQPKIYYNMETEWARSSNMYKPVVLTQIEQEDLINRIINQ